MLRLRSSIVARLFSSPSIFPRSSVHRFLSAAALAVSPIPSFTVEEYLVETCSLTRAQALKTSRKLSHLKSPSKPDAVLSFLADLDFSGTEVAALVARDPQFLCTGVDGILAHNMVRLTGLGLSRTDIARLVSLAPSSFRCRPVVSKLPYYMSLLGSYENLLRVLKRSSRLLSSDLERVVKPNVSFLLECGLGACDIAKLCLAVPRLLSSKQERLQAMVACAEGLGVPRGSGMFRHVLQIVGFREKNVTAQVEYLKKTFSWSDAEVHIVVCKAPSVLKRSKETLQHRSEFFINEVGLEPAYIARQSNMITYTSLEGRLRPRYYVVKFLKENGLVKRDLSYYSAVTVTEKVFMKKYISSHNETAPHLAEDYTAACRGGMPTRFRFT